jgi:hypothetical protein
MPSSLALVPIEDQIFIDKMIHGVLARKARSGVMVVTRNCELRRKGKFFWFFARLRALYLPGRTPQPGAVLVTKTRAIRFAFQVRLRYHKRTGSNPAQSFAY